MSAPRPRVRLLVCGNGGPVRVLPPRHGRGGLLGIRRALADGVAPDGDAGEGLTRWRVMSLLS